MHQMGALELSVDKDWLRYRASVFWASGDTESRVGPSRSTGTARGFDSILDDTQFAGGPFSFFDREEIRLTGTGVALVTPNSLLTSLRSSKGEGESNFVNPGVRVYNAGIDADLTPKLRGFLNFNYLQFDRTQTLTYLLFQSDIHRSIGADSGIGISYRPPLTENIVLTAGVSSLVPGLGLRNIYNSRVLVSGFANLRVRVPGRTPSRQGAGMRLKGRAGRYLMGLLASSCVISLYGVVAASSSSLAARQDAGANMQAPDTQTSPSA